MNENQDERVKLSQDDADLLFNDFIIAVAHLIAVREISVQDPRFSNTPQAEMLTKVIDGAFENMDFAKRLDMEVVLLRNDDGINEIRINGKLQ